MDKNKKLNEGFWPALILTIICIVCTGLLAWTNETTMPARVEAKEAQEQENKLLLFPDAAEFSAFDLDEDGVDFADCVMDEDGKPEGLLIQARAKGYGGEVPVLVAYSLDGEILGVVMPANDETPGLGQKIRNEEFYTQFAGHAAEEELSCANGIDAVSGATISSDGACAAVNRASSVFEELIKEVIDE